MAVNPLFLKQLSPQDACRVLIRHMLRSTEENSITIPMPYYEIETIEDKDVGDFSVTITRNRRGVDVL